MSNLFYINLTGRQDNKTVDLMIGFAGWQAEI
jgi:hypothetical protein